MFGSLRAVQSDRLRFVTETTRRYGPVARFRMGPRVLHLVSCPESAKHVLVDRATSYRKGLGLSHARPLLGDGLLTSEGERWRRQRHATRPALHDVVGRHLVSVTIDETARLLDDWGRSVDDGDSFDLHQQMVRLTLAILCRSLFSLDLRSHSQEIGESFSIAMNEAMFRMSHPVHASRWLPTRRHRRFRRALATLDAIVAEMIATRRRMPGPPNDLLTALVNADASDDGPSSLRDQIMTLLMAGHETTAAALSWTFYLVARHPDVERAMRSEIAGVLHDRPPALEDLPRLTVCRSVLHETLRLYPPVWLIPRRAIQSDTLAGYDIEPGSDVLICPYTMQRRQDLWTDPDAFRPERFIDDEHPVGYLPFGLGPRACVGDRFAMTEATIVVASVLQKHTLRLALPAEVPADASLTLRPSRAIRVTAERVAHRCTA